MKCTDNEKKVDTMCFEALYFGVGYKPAKGAQVPATTHDASPHAARSPHTRMIMHGASPHACMVINPVAIAHNGRWRVLCKCVRAGGGGGRATQV